MKTNILLCGVIEGYYGRPWSLNQRKSLFECCSRYGMNTYVYAPKDDAKHRSRWRDLYTTDELNELSQLIHYTKQCGIYFVYALSPGLDIVYSSEKDLLALKKKFDQLLSIGCENWAILFDDIESEMCQQDKDNFASFAHAQVAVTNQVYDYLNKPNILIFCPTEYCSRMAKPMLETSPYLETIGNGLYPDIDIFWTGPKVVSRRLTVSHMLSVNHVLKRRVTIWDNLNANDYDQRRLCMGPFSGRSTHLSSHISGMLINPNCEFELNFIPIHTLSQWFDAVKLNEKREKIDDDHIPTNETYQVEKAFHQALIQWLPEFNKTKAANDSQNVFKIENSPQSMSPKRAATLLLNDEDSQDSINENVHPSAKIHKMECDAANLALDLTIDDIRLLVEIFYLPYQYGPNAQQLFIDFYWLRFNYDPHRNADEWRCRALSFHNNAKNVTRLLQKLVAIHNRVLLYDIYHYINDINSTIDLCSKYLSWIDDKERRSSAFMSGDVEPWSIRGGLAGQFLNLLPLGDFQSVLKPDLTTSSNFFIIRPMAPNDQPSMYALCTAISYQDEFEHLLNQYSDILADKVIGGYLLNSPVNNGLCFSIDNNEDILCGFVVTINECEKYDKFIHPKWIEQLQQRYANIDQNFFELIECPQWVYNQYPVRVQLFLDLTIEMNSIYHLTNKIFKILIDKLLKQDCRGCHALIDERNVVLHQFYMRLGFIDIPTVDLSDHTILVGKQF